jgi:hypothetical protein
MEPEGSLPQSLVTVTCPYPEPVRGPCHHGMARLQVADGGTASKMEGSCEYIEYAVADSRQEVVLQLGGWARC